MRAPPTRGRTPWRYRCVRSARSEIAARRPGWPRRSLADRDLPRRPPSPPWLADPRRRHRRRPPRDAGSAGPIASQGDRCRSRRGEHGIRGGPDGRERRDRTVRALRLSEEPDAPLRAFLVGDRPRRGGQARRRVVLRMAAIERLVVRPMMGSFPGVRAPYRNDPTRKGGCRRGSEAAGGRALSARVVQPCVAQGGLARRPGGGHQTAYSCGTAPESDRLRLFDALLPHASRCRPANGRRSTDFRPRGQGYPGPGPRVYRSRTARLSICTVPTAPEGAPA